MSPPRIFKVSTIHEEQIEAGSSISFEFDEKYDMTIVGLKVFAESEIYSSNVLYSSVKFPEILPAPVKISRVFVVNDNGDEAISTTVGSKINIGIDTTLQNQLTNVSEFVYYAQVKHSGEKAIVEFIGIAEGSFEHSIEQSPSISWTPTNSGIYYVETFVWSVDAIPIASKGPLIIIFVN